MFGTQDATTIHFTDVARFTGRSPRVLGGESLSGDALGICTTSAAGFDELTLFVHLNALAASLSPSVVWMLTDCHARLADELRRWCTRRGFFWHYCHIQQHFAFTRS